MSIFSRKTDKVMKIELNIPPPIMIVGSACSGLDNIASVLHHAGLWSGIYSFDKTRRTKYHPAFINSKILEQISRPLLKRGRQGDIFGQAYLPTEWNREHIDTKERAEWLQKDLISIMLKQEYTEGQWFVMCGKACLVWTVWNRAFPDAHWILVRRKKEDVIADCLERPYMRAYRTEAGWGEWYDIHVECFNEMILSLKKRIHTVWIELVLAGDYNELQAALGHCDVDISTGGITKALKSVKYKKLDWKGNNLE